MTVKEEFKSNSTQFKIDHALIEIPSINKANCALVQTAEAIATYVIRVVLRNSQVFVKLNYPVLRAVRQNIV